MAFAAAQREQGNRPSQSSVIGIGTCLFIYCSIIFWTSCWATVLFHGNPL